MSKWKSYQNRKLEREDIQEGLGDGPNKDEMMQT